ncbi:FG-GAP-like repeat-containing protein [Fulvivirgaceae bacterium BMA12]|uniref:FG-GAP-like repeat-containing protein n=1 Tax=Agaribacillus aureus TaxID=3051825 RepID=A0ABT8KZD8_9BACT|nr:FG-GAP-like repeat-containing protein [Fulvivirgaceae bacterium BMA12]
MIFRNHSNLPTTGLRFLILIGFIAGCQNVSKNESIFHEVNSDHSQLLFSNFITESDSLNYLTFPYIYLGGGVAIGDMNNDGFSDIYTTGNMVENKLYLNRGDMVFEDVSVAAGVQGSVNKWYAGTTMVDINHDGWLDIYLSVSGKNADTKNELYINNGDLSFTEAAAEFGIDDTSSSIQSTFFDYDKDGDLDLFVANYPPVPLSMGPLFYKQLMEQNKFEFSGHLYKNLGNGSFENVTDAAGVRNFGLTLGIVASDLNRDGWPDLYLSNDFNVPDYLYLNQGDGTFTEVLKESVPHTAMFGMGIDIADFNNDGLADLIQADMTPEDYTRAKVNMASMSPRSFRAGVEQGLHYQYMQNCLQVNNGVSTGGIPLFSDIARLAGMATTDWSWSTIFADLDNDGLKDVYITNGIKRDVNDNDLNKRTQATTFKAAYGKIDVAEYPSEPISNYAFSNNGDFTFENVTERWGLSDKSFSNGMAYGDLDNDGDLDLIVNNIDKKMGLYENKTNGRHFLRVMFRGPEFNPYGLGTKVMLEDVKSESVQTSELTLTRGYQSSMEPIIHFGLGDDISPKVLQVIWPDGKEEIRTISTFDTVIVVRYSAAASNNRIPNIRRALPFKNITGSIKLNFRHVEDIYDDYKLEPLLPHKYSTLGPGIAVADVNDDGYDDFYVGNAGNAPGKLYMQSGHGNFKEMEGPWYEDLDMEDTGALFIDADGDGDQDLYTVSGGYNAALPGKIFQDRLYINVNGAFHKAEALPVMPTSGQVVAGCDYDMDGDEDLFVGGRVSAGKYPQPPQSYLLRNNGKKDYDLKFEDITREQAQELSEVGMITSAVWVDVDGDSWKDLVVAGEWMPVTIFKNEEGELVNKTDEWGLSEKVGWWYGLQSLDVDNDGDMDLIAGNLGLNYKYKASPEKPFEVFLNDFDRNGTDDIVLGVNKKGKLLPLRGRECSSEQVPALKAKYETYREFASADLYDIYGKVMLENSVHYEATTFAHYWLENNGDERFKWHTLPNRSQFSPINRILIFDYDGDDFQDLLVVGGLYDAEVETPRADAGVGLVLRNTNGKGFEAIAPTSSGLYATGNIREAAAIKINRHNGVVFARNNGGLEFVLFESKFSPSD